MNGWMIRYSDQWTILWRHGELIADNMSDMFRLIPQKIVHRTKLEQLWNFLKKEILLTTLRSHSATYMISSTRIFVLTLIKKRVLGYSDYKNHSNISQAVFMTWFYFAFWT